MKNRDELMAIAARLEEVTADLRDLLRRDNVLNDSYYDVVTGDTTYTFRKTEADPERWEYKPRYSYHVYVSERPRGWVYEVWIWRLIEIANRRDRARLFVAGGVMASPVDAMRAAVSVMRGETFYRAHDEWHTESDDPDL